MWTRVAVGVGILVLLIGAIWLATRDVPPEVGRTPWGTPDLSGTWEYADHLPLYRYSLDEDLEWSAEWDAEKAEERNSNPENCGGTENRTGSYDNCFNDQAVPMGARRGVQLILPEDGFWPDLVPDAEARRAELNAFEYPFTDAGQAVRGRNLLAHRPTTERCLHGMNTVWGGHHAYYYNQNYMVFMAGPELVVLHHEMGPTVMVRIGGEHVHSAIRQHDGHAIGWWEEEVLVVEFTNYKDSFNEDGELVYAKTDGYLQATSTYPSGELVVRQRLWMTGADEMMTETHVEDPATFVEPMAWRIAARRTDDLLFEFACNEGNYSLANTLRGGRVEEGALPPGGAN